MTTSNDRIAIITGGSRGLGKSMALHLADHGVDAVITYRAKKDEALAVVSEIEKKGRKAVALALDVGDSSSFGTRFGDRELVTLHAPDPDGKFDWQDQITMRPTAAQPRR